MKDYETIVIIVTVSERPVALNWMRNNNEEIVCDESTDRNEYDKYIWCSVSMLI